LLLCIISGFRREVNENCALQGYYAARSGNTFRENLFGPIFRVQQFRNSWPLKMGRICCPETSIRNYHYLLR